MQLFSQLSMKISKIGLFFSKPDTLFYALPWLMFLVVMGTITQKDLGLYEASEKYFNSIILWMGPLPLPGGLTTIGFIFIALCLKFIFYSPWSKKRAGTIVTHLGILLLLLGGMVTSFTSKEEYMVIAEGQNLAVVSDHFKKEMVISMQVGNGEIHNFENLQDKQTINFSDLEIKILHKCDNCGARAPSGIYTNLQDMAVNMELYSTPSEKLKETNFSGLVLSVTDKKNPDKSGTYIVMEDIPKNPVFVDGKGNKIEISLRRQARPLAFSITLNDFRKIDYPGTNKAREYESDLIIHDGSVSWPVTVSMNEPLRYKGYTFYQSSFEQRPDVEVTVLNVVQNAGRAFPYISTLVIFLGLLLHFIIHLQSKPKKMAAND